jgi:molecular chaperone GrpE (heat shock protein)
MKKEKDFLREKFVEFQLQIAELSHALQQQQDTFQVRENELYLNLFEVLDSVGNLNERMQDKKGEFDKTTMSLARNIGAIHKKLLRMIEARHIVQMEFSDNKAQMKYCKVLDTQESVDLENETIISVVKNGYIDEQHGRVLRKAEVITVLNPR